MEGVTDLLAVQTCPSCLLQPNESLTRTPGLNVSAGRGAVAPAWRGSGTSSGTVKNARSAATLAAKDMRPCSAKSTRVLQGFRPPPRPRGVCVREGGVHVPYAGAETAVRETAASAVLVS